MSHVLPSGAVESFPRCDGARVLFQIIVAGESIDCAISRGALEEIGERRCFKPAEMLRCFGKARERIERIALAKLRARRHPTSHLLHLWADDVDEFPADDSSGAALRQAVFEQSA